jgi:hypothetical protein
MARQESALEVVVKLPDWSEVGTAAGVQVVNDAAHAVSVAEAQSVERELRAGAKEVRRERPGGGTIVWQVPRWRRHPLLRLRYERERRWPT